MQVNKWGKCYIDASKQVVECYIDASKQMEEMDQTPTINAIATF